MGAETERRGVALVTGGSRGIGRAIAVQLARDGHDVAFCYQSKGEAAARVADEIRQLGCGAFHRPCDVANSDCVHAFIQACEKECGEITTLVNNAGIVRDNPLVLMDPQSWSAVIDTNLTGTFNFCRQVVFGFLKHKRGTIVNISSVAGVYGTPGRPTTPPPRRASSASRRRSPRRSHRTTSASTSSLPASS